MMQRVIYAAVALLLLQIGVAVTLNIKNRQTETSTLHAPFLTITSTEVTSIDISAPEKKRVTLKKGTGGWIMPDNFNGRADAQKVDELLQKLSEVKQGLAVATSPAAAQRFKTSPDNFERHLVIQENDTKVGDFYLGTSAGFRYSHVRKADQDDIITIPLSTFEVEAENDQWLDKNQLHLQKNEITTVRLGDLNLVKDDKNWQLKDNSDEDLNISEIEKLIDKISSIAVQSIVDPETVSSLFEKEPVTQVTITSTDKGEIVFTFSKQDDHHVLRASNNENYFKVNSWLVESLQEFTLEKLVNMEDSSSENSAEEKG